MLPRHKLPTGTNLRILYQHCRCDEHTLYRPESVVSQIMQMIQSVGFQAINHTSYAFAESGYTIAIILAESHLVIHTWPEHNKLVLIEISVCDFTQVNREKTIRLGDRLAELFQPVDILDEITSMIPRICTKNVEGYGFRMELDSLITSRKSRFQDIIIADTAAFGRVLLLDGIMQTSEKDDCFYHEPLVHVPMLSHPHPQNVLICGGGDGGAAREVLKHPCVQSCTIVDIDAEVVSLARDHLGVIHQGSLVDPRIHIQIQNAVDFVHTTRSSFDVIILDNTDPVGCAEILFSREFYQDVHQRLAPDGYVSLNIGAPLLFEKNSTRIVQEVHEIFSCGYPYLHFIPSYGSLMGFLLCMKMERELIPLEDVENRLNQRALHDLRIISPNTFHALFAVPPFLHNVFASVSSGKSDP
ncbi:MAG: polyamine aminopropyltransferase [Candidatus Omnitrophota bacterium]|jgi:spermidine synthase|nr:MAG: polyamine aminopropyltransferase [Candidatus Omnitrophota bacterium]